MPVVAIALVGSEAQTIVHTCRNRIPKSPAPCRRACLRPAPNLVRRRSFSALFAGGPRRLFCGVSRGPLAENESRRPQFHGKKPSNQGANQALPILQD